ncbi:LPXTG cell wall anchor domain-containing protein [Mycolicibacterium agri]|uniref:Gram-positive cocci surface proteins LPxTG domain-containing protein n=1 Tax=Mycolicibacterium agri TaxID=36811 RepID=A0A7I9VZB3_MYCAG|nr:hypothetical protein MAGR_22220 [Mycolicibacterium agri]
MATYNCTDSTNSAYGAGSYGTCTGQSVGAPNTGVFEQVLSGGSFTIVAPLAAAIVLVAVAAVLVRRRKKS